MYLNSMEVKYQISRRGENLEKSPIGSKLKYVRKHLNLTLEESAEDICSVSYLSKVENNLIKPTAKYVKLLQQRYHMDKDIKDNHTYDDDLEILIQAFIEEKYETTTDKKHKISEDYQEFIINFANLVLSKQYEKGKIIGNELLFYIPNLPTRSLNFALALMNVLLYKDLRFSDAKDLLLLMNIGQEDIKMSIIQKKWLLRNAIKLRQALLFEKIYPEYKDQLIKYQYFNEILEIENTRKCLYQKTTQYYLNTLNDNKDISIIYLNYLNNQQQYAKIIEKTKTKLYNEEYLKMHLFALENIKEYSNIIKLIKN
ncbi:MAG: helix-turn-helix transcriptional regulator, partial [Acholeplasmataceae bacterium]